MHIETYGPYRLRLVLHPVPLELWLYLDPGHPPHAVWCCSRSGVTLAEVPVSSDTATSRANTDAMPVH